jgi:GH25 family lysozyme M1 (1,4-beta-N-acetylmuramidase)
VRLSAGTAAALALVVRTPLLASSSAVVVAALALGACSSSSGPDDSCSSGAAIDIASSCASGATVKGVDVSTYQGAVDWASVKSSGRVFGIARISDGTANPDDQFVANWQGMKSAGLVRGAYQYFRASVDPTAQANLVLSKLQAAGGFEAGDLPVTMDLETADGESAATIGAHMTTWLAAVEAGTGVKPLIYTSIGTIPVSGAAFSSYPLWVANWGVTCPSLPSGWTTWAFWQNADNGTVSGISGGVDTDEFNGSLAQLQAFGGGGTTTPSPDSGAVDSGGSSPDAGSGSSPDASTGSSDAGATSNDSGTTGNHDSGITVPADGGAGSTMGAGGSGADGGFATTPCGG